MAVNFALVAESAGTRIRVRMQYRGTALNILSPNPASPGAYPVLHHDILHM